MKAPQRLWWIFGLAIAGVLISIYQTIEFFNVRAGVSSFSPLCKAFGENFDCHAVDLSRWSELLPGFPLSSFAAGWFLATAFVTLFARNAFWRREAVRFLLGMNAVGVFFSLIYLVIMLAIIQKYCALCLTIDAINFALLGITLSLKPDGFKEHKPDRSKWKTLGITAGLTSLGVVLLFRATNPIASTSSKVQDLVDYYFARPVENLGNLDAWPSVGPPTAPITLVKFSDFQCPACKRGATAIHPLIGHFGNKIRIVFKNFPLDPGCNSEVKASIHPVACFAAKLALCAHQKDRFESTYMSFFENQERFSERGLSIGDQQKILLDLTRESTGMSPSEIQSCLDSNATWDFLKKDIQGGIDLRIESTPTFFLNGRRVPGAYPTEVWIRIIDQLLKNANL